MPHLGVLSSVHPEIAAEVFDKDCLVRLGTVVAPVGKAKAGKPLVSLKITMPSGEVREEMILAGEITVIPLGVGEEARCQIQPSKNVDVGAGPGHLMNTILHGGLVGIILDGRGRPIELPDNPEERVVTLTRWIETINAYPVDKLQDLQERYPVKSEADERGKKRGGLFGFLRR